MAAHQPSLRNQANQNRMEDKFKKITERVRAFIGGEGGDFDELSHDLFALQYEHVEPYRHLCESRRVTPQNVGPIPAIPTTAFKDFEITSLPPSDRPTIFHSSGTSEQTPSRHFHNADSMALYEESLLTTFRQNLTPTPHTLSLTPSPECAPHSSLAHMMFCIQEKPAFTGTIEDGAWTVNTALSFQKLQDLKTPVTLLGTAFSFVHLCDAIEPIKLPPGSLIMETGGYKGRSRQLPKPELHSLISTTLDVPRENIRCEYGMCEISSQAYAMSNGQFHFPHWARARVVSPETARQVSIGEPGLLEIVDLANVRSVLAVRTADLAVRHEEGFELIGRATHAEPRGCSLTAAR